MHVQKVPNSVARSVPVVQPCVPQRLARDRVQKLALDLAREDGRSERDLALEHVGKCVDLLLRRRSEVHGAGHVGGSVTGKRWKFYLIVE